MSGEIFKQSCRIRRASIRGKEITISPEAQFHPSDEVSIYYDGFILVVPRGVKVNENLLRQSMGVRHEESKATEGKT